jgi:hypothetical protein
VPDEPAAGDAAALDELPEPAEPPPDEHPGAAATTASAAMATAARPPGDRHLVLRITYLASRTMAAGSRRPGKAAPWPIPPPSHRVIIEQSAAGPVRTGSTGQRRSPWPRLAPAARRQAVIPDRDPRRIAPVVSTCPWPAALAQAPNDATPRLPGRSSAAWPRMRIRDARRRAGQVPCRCRCRPGDVFRQVRGDDLPLGVGQAAGIAPLPASSGHERAPYVPRKSLS